MKKRDFPRAIVFGLFIGAGAYIAAGAWHITGLALLGIVLAAAVGAFLLSLMSSPPASYFEAEPSKAAPSGEFSSAHSSNHATHFSGHDSDDGPNWAEELFKPHSLTSTINDYVD